MKFVETRDHVRLQFFAVGQFKSNILCRSMLEREQWTKLDDKKMIT